MANANEELLRSTTEALNRGDMEGFLASHTPDVKFHVAGKGPFSEDHEGREGVGGVFGTMMSLLDAPPTVDVHDCLVNDDHGTLLVTQHLTRPASRWTDSSPGSLLADPTGRTSAGRRLAL